MARWECTGCGYVTAELDGLGKPTAACIKCGAFDWFKHQDPLEPDPS